MAVKTMQVSSQSGKFDAGWHEMTISKTEDGTWTSQAGHDKKYIDLYFEGYPENMNVRIFEVVNKETGEEFKIANLFRYANAGILGVLKDPTGKKPVIQYDDEPSNLVGKTLNLLFYKDSKGYIKISDRIAPVEQEGEVVSYNADDVKFWKDKAEEDWIKRLKPQAEASVSTEATTTGENVPF